MRNIQVRLKDEIAQWFDDHFPMFGARQWFVESCFDALRELSEDGEVETPVDLASSVVKEVTKHL